MKKLISIIGLCGLMYSPAFAYQHEAMASITSIQGNGSFPIELVKVKYLRHCSHAFSNAWMKQVNSNMIGLAITVKSGVNNSCHFHEPEYVEESVLLPIPADVPTRYFPLRTLNGTGHLSGVSVDNFN